MTTLQKVTITFNTHDDGKEANTNLHVFVKNRKGDSSTPEEETDFISNSLAFDIHADNVYEPNPYLAGGVYLDGGLSFDKGLSLTREIPLRTSTPIPIEEIELPVVNIHILPDDNGDQWSSFYYQSSCLT
jgi:hypothetical protein